MNNAVLYNQNNSLQKRDALICLEEYVPKMISKKSSHRIIDIGSGDGSLTKTLKTYFPSEVKILGCDISENMVNFANDHYKDEQISFIELDIARELPEDLKGNFDHVFSCYALHWISDQQSAFQNIYNLLDIGGDCLMCIATYYPGNDVYRMLSKKWTTYLIDVERKIAAYHDSKEPEKEIFNMMSNLGFVNIDIQCRDTEYKFNDVNSLRNFFEAVNAFKIPEDLLDEYMSDFLQALKELQIAENSHSSQEYKFRYSYLVVYGQKPVKKQSKQLSEL